jgi:peptidoglycan/xylan/chitin deacetylase (PgdA/CDA1 family)
VAAAGHVIVNHTWHHYNLGYLSARAVQDEISRATGMIHAATGVRPGMFRAPYGVWPPVVFGYCAQAGLTPLAWSVDPRDWSRPGAPRRPRDRRRQPGRPPHRLDHPGARRRRKPLADRGGAEDLAAPAARRGLSVHHPVSPVS